MIKKSGFLALLLLLSAGSAHAVKFGVRVVSDTGEPLSGVAVCFGTHGNYKQFGAIFTSTNGDAVLEVPSIPLVVTISKNRFAGVRLTEPARRYNLVKEVRLGDSVPGPRCRAGSSLASETMAAEKRLQITEVLVEDGAYVVSLYPSVRGNPSHYRVSKSQSFTNAPWRRFSSEIDLDGALADSDSVYLQVRRYMSVSGGSIEARSDIVSVQIPEA